MLLYVAHMLTHYRWVSGCKRHGFKTPPPRTFLLESRLDPTWKFGFLNWVESVIDPYLSRLGRKAVPHFSQNLHLDFSVKSLSPNLVLDQHDSSMSKCLGKTHLNIHYIVFLVWVENECEIVGRYNCLVMVEIMWAQDHGSFLGCLHRLPTKTINMAHTKF